MWLYIPSASARASAESSEDLNSRHLERLSRCCTASGKSAQPRSLQRRLSVEIYQPLRFGLTLRPSHAARRLASWIKSASNASRAVIRASHSAQPASDAAKTIRATYGRGLLKRLSDMHRLCCFSRMSEGTLFSDLNRSETIWIDWVTGLRQVCSRRQKLARRIGESGYLSSAWPTAGANDHKGAARPGQRRGQLDEAAEQLWSSPKASDSDHGGPNMRNGSTVPLPSQVTRLHQQVATGETSSSDFQSSPRLWQTPVANDDNKTPEAHLAMKSRMPGGARKTITSLQVLTKQWASPNVANASNTRDRTATRTQDGKHNDGETLCDQVYPKRLNPLFVAWLMGYLVPISCEPTETRLSQNVRQWLSSVCGQH